MADIFEQHETVNGSVEKITYRNEQNGYTVMIVNSADTDTITVVGIVPFIKEGDYVECDGRYIVHSTYGEQFKADTINRIVKNDIASVLRYLSGRNIRGIGPVTARKIVEKFGTESLNVIENDPNRLSTVKGITFERALEIQDSYKKQFGLREVIMALSPYNISTDEAMLIYKKLGNSAESVIKSNPYILCSSGIDFSFERVEEIADGYAFNKNDSNRIEAGIIYVLRRNLLNGHTCLPKNKLVDVAARLLECTLEQVESVCDNLVQTFMLSTESTDDNTYIFLPEYKSSERFIAGRLSAVMENIPNIVDISDVEIDFIESKLSIEFEEMQREAIKSAIQNGVLILTGGPGTGKTTTLNAIIELLENRNLDISLAAPTGRAAKRMTELTGRESKTIHRLLEVEWTDEDKHTFSRNEKNPLGCDAIIIDEMSMVDTLLFESLLRALRPGCRIIMVGDSDQLPSVGAGNILNDLLSCGFIPSVKLKKVFRQAGKSRIITAAHDIINNSKVVFDNNKDTDLFFMHINNLKNCVSTVVDVATQRIPSAYNFSPINDIQVLCPSRKFDCGTVNINTLLQERLNPKTKHTEEIYYRGGFIRTGDKVMQIKNNYDIEWDRDNGETGGGVFNGDIGIVKKIDKRMNIITVKFDDRTAVYTSEDISQLELAYAVTVHKSQGSEFDCVILPLFDVPNMLQYRNLLYTAVTRAKKLLIVIGKEELFDRMAANDKKTLRYTCLNHFLKVAFK